VVALGARVRPNDGYAQLYSTLLADRPAAGRRTTWLTVRVDVAESVPGLAYRPTIGAAAAAATERILNGLGQQGIRAHALNAAELDAALTELGAGLVTSAVPAASEPTATVRAGHTGGARLQRARPGWHEVTGRSGHQSTYYVSPEHIGTAALNQLWALRSDELVTVVSLTSDRRGRPGGTAPVAVSALVRTTDPQRRRQPPTLHLNSLPGEQLGAAAWAAPTVRPRLRLPTRPLPDPGALQLPIGPTGVLVGAALHDAPGASPPRRRDDLVLWPLTDAHRPARIVCETSEFYLRQLLLRAVAAGERVVIHADDPRRWNGLAQANLAVVTGHGRPHDFVPTIVVAAVTAPPPGGPPCTIITLGRDHTSGATPDLHFVQTSDATVRVSSRTVTLDLAIVAFRQEQAWTG
jgi:hypothetical protein